MAGSGMRTFHVPLTEALHDDLRREATAAARPATEIVREALAVWLLERRRARLDEEIERYARAHAGGPFDLDPELEEAGIEHLLAMDPS